MNQISAGKLVRLILFSLIFSLSANGQQQASSEDELKKQADKAFASDNFEEALSPYSQLLSLYPSNAGYNYRYGVSLLLAGKNKANSVSYLEIAAKDATNPDEVWIYLGQAYMAIGKFDNALGSFKKFESKVNSSKLKKFNCEELEANCVNAIELLKSRKNIVINSTKDVPRNEFYKFYDWSKANGKLVPAAEQFLTTMDKDNQLNPVMFIANDKQTIYLSSYGKKGERGKDIYIIRKMPNGDWSAPENLGETINSEANEDFPYLDRDGRTLYFSSKSKKSIGGYDIFKSKYDFNTGKWSTPENLGWPINSIGDDFLYVPISNGAEAYYSTSINSAKNEIELKKILLPDLTEQLVTISGYYAPTDQKVRRDARITILNADGSGIVTSVLTDPTTGKYDVTLEPGKDYTIVVEGGGYLAHAENFSLPSKIENSQLKQVVKVERTKTNENLTLENYFYQKSLERDVPSEVKTASFDSQADTSEMMAVTINNQTVMVTKPGSGSKTASADKQDSKELNLVKIEKKDQYDPTLIGAPSEDEVRQKQEEEKRSKEVANENTKSSNYDITIGNEELASIAISDAKTAREEADSLNREVERLNAGAVERDSLYLQMNAQAEKASEQDKNSYLNEAYVLKTDADNMRRQADDIQIAAIAKEQEAKSSEEEANALLAEINSGKGKKNTTLASNAKESPSKSDNKKGSTSGYNTSADSGKPSDKKDSSQLATTTETDPNKTTTQAKPESSESTPSTKSDTNLTESENAISTDKSIAQTSQQDSIIIHPETAIANPVVNEKKSNEKVAESSDSNKSKEEIANNTNITSPPISDSLPLADNTEITSSAETPSKESETKSEQDAVKSNSSDNTIAGNATSAKENSSNPEKSKSDNSNKVNSSAEPTNSSNQVDNVSKKESGNVDAITSKQTEVGSTEKVAEEKGTSAQIDSKNVDVKSADSKISLGSDKNDLANNTTIENKSNAKEAEPTVSNPNPSSDSTSPVVSSTSVDSNVSSTQSPDSKTEISSDKKVANVDQQKVKDAEKEIASAENDETITSKTEITTTQSESNKELAKNTDITNQVGEEGQKENEKAKPADNSSSNPELATNSSTDQKNSEQNLKTDGSVSQNGVESKKVDGNPSNNVKSDLNNSADSNKSAESTQQISETTNVNSSPEVKPVFMVPEEEKKPFPSNINTLKVNSVSEEARIAYQAFKSKYSTSKQLSNQSIELQNRISATKSSPERDSLIYVSNSLVEQSETQYTEALQQLKAAQEIDPDVKTKMELNEQIIAYSSSMPSGKNGKASPTLNSNDQTVNNSKTVDTTIPADSNTNQSVPDNTVVEPNNNTTQSNTGQSVADNATPETKKQTTEKEQSNNDQVATSQESSTEKVKSDVEGSVVNKSQEETNPAANDNQIAMNSTENANSSENTEAVADPYALSPEEAKEVDEMSTFSVETPNGKEVVKIDTTGLNTRHPDFKKYVEINKEITNKQVETIDVFAEAVNQNKLAVEQKEEQNKLMDKADVEKDLPTKAQIFIKADAYRDSSKKNEEESAAKFAMAQSKTGEVKAKTAEMQEIRKRIAIPGREVPTQATNSKVKPKGLTDEEVLAMTKVEDKKDVVVNKTIASSPANSETPTSQFTPETIQQFAKQSFSIANSPVYNKENPIPMNPSMPDGLVFKVQIGAFRNEIPAEKFSGVQPITGETTRPGWVRYCVGLFQTFEPAVVVKKEMQQRGFKDAFVVAYLNGKRIGLDEAYAMIGKGNATPDKNYAQTSQNEMALLRANNIRPENISSIRNNVMDEDENTFYGNNAAKVKSSLAAIEYSVQVGVYRTQVTPRGISSLSPLFTEKIRTNLYRFTTDHYLNYASADSMKRIARSSGVKDAFIVVYRNGVQSALSSVPIAERTIKTNPVSTETAVAPVTPVSTPVAKSSTPEVKEQVVANTNSNTSQFPSAEAIDDKIIYRVQIGAFKNNIPFTAVVAFLNVADKGITQLTDDRGLHIFYAGTSENFGKAATLREEIVSKGVTDAFVVALQGGKRIVITDEMKSK